MANEFRGVTFDLQTVTAKDNAQLWRAMFGNQDGVIHGCEVGFNTVGVTISKGSFLACGRQIAIDNDITVPTQHIADGSNRAAIVFRIDLTKEPSTTEFTQGELVVTGRNFPFQGEPALTREDINTNGNIYEILVAWVKVDADRKPTEIISSWKPLATMLGDIASVLDAINGEVV